MQFCSLCDLGTSLVVPIPGGRSVFYPHCARVEKKNEKASDDYSYSHSSHYVLSFPISLAPIPPSLSFNYLHSVKWLVTLLVP